MDEITLAFDQLEPVVERIKSNLNAYPNREWDLKVFDELLSEYTRLSSDENIRIWTEDGLT